MTPPKRSTRKSTHKTARKTTRRVAHRSPTSPRLNSYFRDVNVVWYNVTDWERAKKFYGETLGLPVAAQLEGVGWIEYGLSNQTHLALNHWQSTEPMPTDLGGATVILGCDDVRAFIEKLRTQGIRCDEVNEIPGMVILGTFYDPDGNRLQVAQSLQ